MSKTKLIVAILVGVVALTALASSSASAASWKVNGALLLVLKTLATKAVVTENGTLSFGGVTIECTGLEGIEPEIVHIDIANATSLVFTGCKATGANCTLVGTTVSTVPVTALILITPGTPVLDHAVVKPKTKTTFATLEFSGASCAFASEVQPVIGTALVSAPTGQTENTEQEIVANTPSGELKVGSSAAILKGKAKIKLTSGERWSFS